MLKKSLSILTITSMMYAAGQDEVKNNTSIVNKRNIDNKFSQANVKTEKYQILSNNINSKNSITTAIGDVLIISKSYYMTADKVIYDKKNETFELHGNVVVLKNNLIQTISDYTFIDIKNDNFKQNPTLILNKKSLLWINSSDSDKTDEIVTLKDSLLSSCDCEDPDWSIRFSSGEYDTKEQWVQTFNNRLYIGSTPVMYIPYFAFPADNTRRTGVLIPTIGKSSTDGFIYEQPIFIAPKENYDIEIIPQHMSKRGNGMYSYFRYADSEDSVLEIGAGVFKEKNSYFRSNNLEHQTHSGYKLNYKNRGLFTKNENAQDGLFADIDWISDIEFKNLEIDSHSSSYEKKIESKINYFYNTPNYYTGIYFTYYLDTSLKSNSQTMQKIPQAQVHTYSKPILLDNLLYSTDSKITSFNREKDITANVFDFSLPITYSTQLFDDYLNVTLKNETKVSLFEYSNETGSDFEDGTFIENISTLTLGTDLLKSYEDYIHTINLNIDFTLPTTLVDEGDLYSITTNNSDLSEFSATETKKTMSFSLNHSLYDSDDLTQIINHKIKQSILYNNTNTRLSNLENEITFNYILGYIRNRILYSQLDNKLIESSTNLTLNYGDYFLNTSHYMSENTPNSGFEDQESYTFELGTKFLKDYSISYSQRYNIEESTRTDEKLKLGINDKCWNFYVSVEKEVIATDSNSNDSVEQDKIYFMFELKQLGGINFTH